MGKSSRTPLMAALRRCYRLSTVPENREAPVSAFSRRDFLKGMLAAGAAVALPGCAPRRPAGPPPKIAVVGAGIAGLAAAWHLSKAGLRAEVFEAAPAAGGRILTLRDAVVDGTWTEAGGEFIDSGHADMMTLAKELGLALIDMESPDLRGPAGKPWRETSWRFGGSLRSEAEVVEAVKAAAPRMQPDIDALPEEIRAGTQGRAAELDRMSLEEYLGKQGLPPWFKDLLTSAYVTEFGLDAGEQSALNLLTLVSTDVKSGRFAVYGESDERFRVDGGNQRIVDGLARKLGDCIHPGHRLEALEDRKPGFRLFFQGPGGATQHEADVVILALPFTMLRSVDLRVELPPGKRAAIAQLGYGTNSKLFMGFKSRPWRDAGCAGYFFTDEGMQSGWDHTRGQKAAGGGLTVFQGGAAGLALVNGSPDFQTRKFSDSLERLFPGAREAGNGRLGLFLWPSRPYALGSYACYKPGQWTSIAGEEGKEVGNLLFAGEHCSLDFQGYMNGGAATGRMAAQTLLARLGRTA